MPSPSNFCLVSSVESYVIIQPMFVDEYDIVTDVVHLHKYQIKKGFQIAYKDMLHIYISLYSK